jgi:hypothetical protein
MSPLNAVICTTTYIYLKRGLQMILKVGYPKIISTQISEQKILMRFLSDNIPKWNKQAEKISQKNPGVQFLQLYFEPLHGKLNPPPHFYQKRGVHNTIRGFDIP